MKNNWLKTVADINKNLYSVPEGWDTRDQVAASLQCAPDKVADLLKPGLQAGVIEKRSFPVWDDSRRMAIPVQCYRMVSSKPSVEPPKDKREEVLRALQANPKARDYDIARRLRVDQQFVVDCRASM